jgi:dihydroorotate dehydrogenase (NAD+) catalytic subunit
LHEVFSCSQGHVMPCPSQDNMIDITIQLAPNHPRGLMLQNPVMLASGTCGYGIELQGVIDIEKLGAIISKGTTLEPRDGNPQPRVAETACGMLNSIGLQNPGIDAVVKEKAPVWAGWKVPVIVNIAGSNIDEYSTTAAALKHVKGVAGIEVNISCPNIRSGGMEFGCNPDIAAEVTREVKASSGLPVIVKLGPNVTDIVEIALAVEKAGADAITLINTLKGMAIDVKTGKPVLGNVFGGLSGPAIKPVALAMVYRAARVVKIPIIGCGGITKAEDAIEFFMAGAAAVQVGTANLSNPGAAIEILDGISSFLENRGYKSLKDIIGLAAR